MLGNIGKAVSEMQKHAEENERTAKLMQKIIKDSEIPANVAKSIEKVLRTQLEGVKKLSKSVVQADKETKAAESEMKKSSGKDNLALLKELEKAINQQGEIVKKLIKNASKA